MLPVLLRRDVAPRRRPVPDDRGLSMVEVLMAVLTIGVLMASLAVYFVRSTSLMAHQRARQAAVQVADGAVERVRSLPGTNLTDNRSRAAVDQQWSNPVPGTAGYLNGLEPAYDAQARADRTPTMPLTETVQLNGIAYTRHAYLGRCWQRSGDADCVRTPLTDGAPLLRVIVAVTWPERTCAPRVCSYVTATLVSTEGQDPMFNINEEADPPTITFPGAQISRVGTPTTLRLAASGGAGPLTWTFTNLPPGLTGHADGTVTGTPTQTADQPVTVKVVDLFNLPDQITFHWTVSANPATPTLADPGPQTTQVQHSVRLPIAITGGTTPLRWTATGMPPGLTISATTGLITGVPDTTGTFPVTVSVTDTRGLNSSVSFGWTVTTATVSQSYFNAVLAEPLLIGYYRLGESGPPLAADASGYGWTGTYVGTPLFGRPGVIAGDTDTAVELTGDGSGFNLGDRHDFSDRAQFSLEAWVRPRSLGTNGEVKTIFRKMGASGFALTLDATNGFAVRRQGSTGADTAVSGPVTTDRWYHVLASYDEANLDLYVDGVQEQRTSATRSVEPNDVPLEVGFSTDVAGSGFDGHLDELAVYSRAFSPSEVAAHHQIGTN